MKINKSQICKIQKRKKLNAEFKKKMITIK